MKKRTLSILILTALLCSSACGSGTAADTTTVPDAQSDTTAAPAPAEIISSDLPEKDYGGYEF